MTAVVNRRLGERVDVLADRSPARRHLRWLMGLVLLADLVTLTGTVVLAWNLRLSLTFLPSTLSAKESLAENFGPWMVLGWLGVLVLRGASTRSRSSAPAPRSSAGSSAPRQRRPARPGWSAT